MTYGPPLCNHDDHLPRGEGCGVLGPYWYHVCTLPAGHDTDQPMPEHCNGTVRFWRAEPVCCVYCHGLDRNLMLHRQNHGTGGRWDGCVAQYLRGNQLRYAMAHHSIEQLITAIRRYLDVRAPDHELLAAARDRLRTLGRQAAAKNLPPADHHAVPDSEQGVLL